MKPFSLVFTFFRSLSLAHLERSLFSLSKQTVKPDEFIVYCNDVEFGFHDCLGLVRRYFKSGEYKFEWDNHGDPSKRNASYAQNNSIKMAKNDLFIFAKADCIFAPTFCERLLEAKGDNPMAFSACWLKQMDYWSEKGKPHEEVDHAKDLESLGWREDVYRLNQNTGQLHNHAWMDAPCFCTTKQAMETAGWYDENLRGWSIWQLDLQGMMHKRGVHFQIIEEVLYWHLMHGLPAGEGERDLKKAHEIYDASPRRNDPNFA